VNSSPARPRKTEPVLGLRKTTETIGRGKNGRKTDPTCGYTTPGTHYLPITLPSTDKQGSYSSTPLPVTPFSPAYTPEERHTTGWDLPPQFFPTETHELQDRHHGAPACPAFLREGRTTPGVRLTPQRKNYGRTRPPPPDAVGVMVWTPVLGCRSVDVRDAAKT